MQVILSLSMEKISIFIFCQVELSTRNVSRSLVSNSVHKGMSSIPRLSNLFFAQNIKLLAKVVSSFPRISTFF